MAIERLFIENVFLQPSVTTNSAEEEKKQHKEANTSNKKQDMGGMSGMGGGSDGAPVEVRQSAVHYVTELL